MVSTHTATPLIRRLLAVAGLALIALAAASPAKAANVFSPGQTVGNPNQFHYAAGLAVRADGQVLVADSDYDAGQKVLRFDTANALQNTASISGTGGGAGIDCVTATGGTDFIVNSPWDRPIRKYDQGGSEIGWVDGSSMWSGNGYNGNPGPGNTRCVVRSGDYLFAISDRGSSSTLPSLSRWNVSDFTLGPIREGAPFGGYLTGLAVDLASNVYVVDSGADQLHSFDSALQLRWSAGSSGTGAGQLSNPSGVAVDPSNGFAYVVDNGDDVTMADNRLVVFDIFSGDFVKTVKTSFNVSAITFDATNNWDPIISDGNSVYRGSFAVRPQVRITGKPRRVSKSRVASFRFASDEPDTAFTCQLDRGRAKSCRAVTRFKGLRPGRHTLKVTGNAPDALPSTAVTWRWTVR